MQVGDRVRRSGYAIMPLRDHWNNCGDYTRKTRARDALDRALTDRGTVVEVLSHGLKVQWDDGQIVQCLNYSVERVTNDRTSQL